MKTKKPTSWLAYLGLAVVVFAPTGADAITILNPGNVAKGTLFGTIDPGLSADDPNEVAFVNFLLGMGGPETKTGPPNAPGGGPDGTPQSYETFFDLNVSDPLVLADYTKTDNDSTGVAKGFELVLGKYGNGISAVWYLGGDSFTLPETFTYDGKTTSLSHSATFGPSTNTIPGTPDGGMTVTLLGLSLAGLGFLRRKLA